MSSVGYMYLLMSALILGGVGVALLFQRRSDRLKAAYLAAEKAKLAEPVVDGPSYSNDLAATIEASMAASGADDSDERVLVAASGNRASSSRGALEGLKFTEKLAEQLFTFSANGGDENLVTLKKVRQTVAR